MQALRWLAAHAVTRPLAFCCLTVTKLLVLDRLLHYSQLETAAPSSRSRWKTFFHVLVGTFVVGNVLGLCGNIAASVFFVRAAAYEEMYLTRIPLNSSSIELNADALDSVNLGMKSAVFFMGFETIVLPLIVIAFTAVGIASIRRIQAATNAAHLITISSPLSVRGVNADGSSPLDHAPALDRAVSSGLYLKRQIFITCIVVFFSFSMRAAYTSVFAFSLALQGSPADCPTYENFCSDCYNVHYFMTLWLLYTPDLFFAVTLVSQPLALLVALWGMTSRNMLRIIKGGPDS